MKATTIRGVAALFLTVLLALLALPTSAATMAPDAPASQDPGDTANETKEAEELQECAPGKENACRCAGMMWCYEIGGPLPIPPFMCKLTRSAQADTLCGDLKAKIALDCRARAEKSIGGGEWSCSSVSKKTGATVLHCAGYLK